VPVAQRSADEVATTRGCAMTEVTTKTLVEAGITRQGVFIRDDGTPYPGGPCISQAVIRGDTVYLCGVVSPQIWRNPSKPTFGDVQAQTTQVLQRIDELLADAGTNKSKLLTAQVWLADMSLFAEHNEAWNAWVDPATRQCAPVSRPD
jgi:enamine deaminase RidA (YjgF/YER057c/UK114 family)